MRLCPRCRAVTRRVTQFDEADWIDFERDVFHELAADTFEEHEDADYAQDAVPPRGTDEVAARIFAAALRSGASGVRAQVAFGYGREGRQAEPTDAVQSIVDMQFRGPDGATVNLEVDNRRGSMNHHRLGHLRAIQAAVRRGRARPEDARSVFTLTNRAGRIGEVWHVRYESQGQTVVPVERAFGLTRPLTPGDAWRKGVVRSPEIAAQHGRALAAVPLLSTTAQLSLPLRPRRFDAFEDSIDALEAY